MKRTGVLGVTIVVLVLSLVPAADTIRIKGNEKLARQLQARVYKWVDAFNRCDIGKTRSMFEDEYIEMFEGRRDQSVAEETAAERTACKTLTAKALIEEISAFDDSGVVIISWTWTDRQSAKVARTRSLGLWRRKQGVWKLWYAANYEIR